MPSELKFDLWRQLQLLNKIYNADKKNSSPLKILLQSLRQFHSREPASDDAKVVALPRSIFWKLFFGIIPLPGNCNVIEGLSSENNNGRSSPATAPSPANPSSPTTQDQKKKGLFDDTDEEEEKQKEEEEQKKKDDSSSSDTDAKKPAAPIIKTNALKDSSSSSDDDSDNDASKNKKKSPPRNNIASSSSQYTPEKIKEAVDKSREEYEEWYRNKYHTDVHDPAPATGDGNTQSGGATATSAGSKPKITFASSKKKKNDAGPRFGDDSSDSDSSEDGDIADPLSAANGQSTAGGAGGGGTIAKEDDPLGNAHDPKWQKYFARKKELELIDKDLKRLYFDYYDFFETPEARRMTKNILEASLDLELVSSYSQGMHENVALILWVLEMDAVRFDVPEDSSDSTSASDEDDDNSKKQQKQPKGFNFTSHIMSKKHLEHDAFLIYKFLIKHFNLGAWYENQPPGTEKSITRVVDEIHTRRLVKADKPLHDHLKALDIPVATYGLRWLRLLFIREFPLSQAMKIWDVAFAEFCATKGQKKVWHSLIPEIALSMLLFIARELVDSDMTDTLRRLMRFPPVEDVALIYNNAISRAYPSANGYSLMRELLPSDMPASPKKGGQHKDPEQQHQEGLFDQISNLVTSSTRAVVTAAQSIVSAGADATKQQQPQKVSAKGMFDDSSDDDASGSNKKKTAATTTTAKQPEQPDNTPASKLDLYALQQKMKLLGNRIDRILIDKLDASDDEATSSSDDDDDDAKKKKKPVTETQIKSAIVELRKIRDELKSGKA